MTGKNAKTFLQAGKTIRFMLVVFLFAAFLVYGGCKKKEEPAHKGGAGPGVCTIYDKLPEGIAKVVEVNYEGKVKLLGITVNKLSKDQLKVSYFWQILGDPGAYNKVFVHFTDSNNKSLFQDDHTLCQRESFGDLKGKFIQETDMVNFPSDAAGKEISVKIGLYTPSGIGASGRLKIESAGWVPLDEQNTRAIVEKFNL
ncbi:MAG: hypothetical protein A2Y81_10935 [Nitrospirae bacterium RBG_13_43_8]|nr:MAG: hypothetical protein A2Y81_10935 [Nitrospirae bacterium RBG_13_43_8]